MSSIPNATAADIGLTWMDRPALKRAQTLVTDHHYLHKPMVNQSSPAGYDIYGYHGDHLGILMFGRPEATKVAGWYADKTFWTVVNLARVWIRPAAQPGGRLYNPETLPGFTDRHGVWRSALASTAIDQALDRIGPDYLLKNPPCFLDEPYELAWCLSYCDARIHRGALYKASGFKLYRKNSDGIETYRRSLRPLTQAEHSRIAQASYHSQRSRMHRGRRLAETAQLEMAL